MMSTVQAKAKVRARKEERERLEHEAIETFKLWKKSHPMATTQGCFDAFDMFIDSVELEQVMKSAS